MLGQYCPFGQTKQKVLNLKGNYKKKKPARIALNKELKDLILAPGVGEQNWTLHEEIIKQFIEDKDLGLVLYKAVYDGEEIITFEEL